MSLRNFVRRSFVFLSIALSAAAAVSLSTATAALAREDAGGYYYSLSHPDLGGRVEKDSDYRVGEGYYGALPKPEAPTGTGTSSQIQTTTVVASPAPEASSAPIAQKQSNTAVTASQTAASAPANLSSVAMLPSLNSAALLPNVGGKPPSIKPLSYAALMKEGQDEFRQNAFHAAKDTFAQAVQVEPNSQDAHFWLAMSDWHLNDYEDTQDELNVVLHLNPFSTEGQVAKSRMLDIAAYLDSEKRPAVDAPEVVRQTMNQIANQAYSLRDQKFLDGENTAAQRTYLAGLEAEKIMLDTHHYLRSAYRDARYYGYVPSNLGEVSDLGYIRSHYARSDGAVQAWAAQRDARLRSLNVQDWQNHLLQGLGDAPRQGDPRLRALGTNLYVQNYATGNVYGSVLAEPSDPALKAVALPYTKQFHK